MVLDGCYLFIVSFFSFSLFLFFFFFFRKCLSLCLFSVCSLEQTLMLMFCIVKLSYYKKKESYML